MAAADPGKHLITTAEQLEAVFSEPPVANALTKEIDHINGAYRALIEAAPFFALATTGPEGLDCSPRGDPAGFVRVADEKTLLIPDRRGNNRLDTLRNVVADPRVGLLFLVPGVGHELRVRGTAAVSTDPDELARHEVRGALPASVLVVIVERVYFQCARAIKRSHLWEPAAWPDPASVPTAGQMTLEAGGFRSREEARDGDSSRRTAPT